MQQLKRAMRVDCFPDAPIEWSRQAIKEIAEVSPRYRLDKNKEYPFVEMASVSENFCGITRFGLRKPESTGFVRFKENDIIFGKITPCAENGKVALVTNLPDEYGVGSTEFIVLSPKEGHDPRFVYALVSSNPVHGRAVSRMEGSTGRLRITEDTFNKWLLVAVPLYEEQVKIADALEIVDKAIAKTKDEIAATERLRKALMQQLFTRGLPGKHQRFKQTKIGEIPEEWEVLQIKKALTEPPFNGVSPPSREEPPGTPILNVSCIGTGLCDPSFVTYVDVDERTIEKCLAQKGDFYVLRGNGNRKHVATGGLLRVEPDPLCIFSDKLIRLRFDSEVVAEGFIPWMWQSESFLCRLQSKAETGSGLWMMSKRDIKRELFPRPNLEEQERIVEILESILAASNSLDTNLKALSNLKKSLLQNLLTGKIRVSV